MSEIFKKILLGAALIAGCSLASGCTTSGEHLSKYKDLDVRVNYTSTFVLEPAAHSPESVYMNFRDLSGSDLDKIFNTKMAAEIYDDPNLALAPDSATADIVINATISAIDNSSVQSQGGVITGAVAGAATGAVIASSRHGHGRFHHHHRYSGGEAALPLILGLVGAGIGYIIDDNLSVDKIVFTVTLDVRQRDGEGGFYPTKYTTAVLSGQQLNMNRAQATDQLFTNLTKSFHQLIKH